MWRERERKHSSKEGLKTGPEMKKIIFNVRDTFKKLNSV